MAKNQIQFQKGISIHEVISLYGHIDTPLCQHPPQIPLLNLTTIMCVAAIITTNKGNA
ncbi:hypothetical protein [Photorhabdus sp. RM71S]|uniref:hypothetical protein n=1 Tax=Photorhabdus sp. RM71S TaxID=3342824 RepID=UPI0036DF0174